MLACINLPTTPAYGIRIQLQARLLAVHRQGYCINASPPPNPPSPPNQMQCLPIKWYEAAKIPPRPVTSIADDAFHGNLDTFP